VFGIFTSRAMRERGRYQIQCMKSRSSTGVGQKIDLTYNIETMRITDDGEEADSGGGSMGTNILSQIKTNSTVNPGDNTPKINAEVNSSKLKNMLAGLKKVE
jgi:hypothetical protein